MQKKTKPTDGKRFSGHIMAGIGFLMLLANAFAYLFGWDMRHPAFTVLGLVFVVIGMGMVKKNRK
jgi:hypothetical protein